MKPGEELAVRGGETLDPAQLQGEGVVNDALNAVSTGQALTVTSHGGLSLLILINKR